jgi:ACS family glucarate transporter-like MFS transporter
LKDPSLEIPPRAASARPTRARYRVLAAACLLALIAYLHRVGFASVGTYLKADLQLSDADWSRVMAAFLVAYALFEVPWGVLGDRLGARHLLVIMSLGWSLLTALSALVAFLPASSTRGAALLNLAILVALRFLFGGFQAGAFPALSRVMADWMPIQERGKAQGLIWMSSRIGGAIAPFLLGWLVARSGGWPGSLALVSALGLLWCVWFWPWFRNRPEEAGAVNQAERELIARGRGAVPAGHGKVPWALFLRSRSVRGLCLMYGFAGFTSCFYVTLLPSYLRNQRGLSPGKAEWLTALPLAFGIAACLGGGVISDWILRRTGNRKWGRRLPALAGLGLAGFWILSTNWVVETGPRAALLCLGFFCYDLAMGPAWASCADIGERHAGALGGAMNMVGNLGGASGALVAGHLLGKEFTLPFGPGAGYTVQGNDLVFVAFAASFWMGALSWLLVDASKPLPAAGDRDATARSR